MSRACGWFGLNTPSARVAGKGSDIGCGVAVLGDDDTGVCPKGQSDFTNDRKALITAIICIDHSR